MVENIAEVIVSNTSRSVDKIFHYLIPPKYSNEVKVGSRVIVSFGKGNKKTEAYVINLIGFSKLTELKEVSSIVDSVPLFDEKMVYLIHWLREKYLCTYHEAVKALLPPGIGLKFHEWIKINNTLDRDIIEQKTACSPVQQKLLKIILENGGAIEYSELIALTDNQKIQPSIKSMVKKGIVIISNDYFSLVKDKKIRVAYLAVSQEEAEYQLEDLMVKAPVQARIIEILLENEFVSVADLVLFSRGSHSAVNTLHKKGLIVFRDHIVIRNPVDEKSIKRTTAFDATQEQINVIKCINKKLNEEVPFSFMLRGVTGSGKTEVYLQVIDDVISRGKQAIVLVPEIALTPQMVERFIGRFGSRVAVFHSGLSMGERYDQWKKIRELQVDVVVGARSAIFAPFKNLGIIILDEEHENSYKSELSPRYHAREVAEYRSKVENAVVIYSSATPSIESYYKGQTGEYALLEMTRRYNDLSLPLVEIIDMREELINGNKSIFSSKLKTEIEHNLYNGQQTILFLNRRGFSTFVSCRNCGFVMTCPHCNISLTYHANNDRLICHYCGYGVRNVSSCPKCASNYIRHFGIGTQRVEQEIKLLFPSASVLRMDVDTTRTKFSHERILNTFRDQNIDILIGTQMVSKGLDFPGVTLVGVLAADMSLNIDDYRSSERTFQLITQVSGRAGRGDIKGRAVIQTYQPEDSTIQIARTHDYQTFYNNEISIRKQLRYPPFSEIISILVSGVDENAVINRIKQIASVVKDKVENNNQIKICNELLGPMPAPISKIKNKHRWRLLIKCTDSNRIRGMLSILLNEHYIDRNNKGLSLIIDINPVNMY